MQKCPLSNAPLSNAKMLEAKLIAKLVNSSFTWNVRQKQLVTNHLHIEWPPLLKTWYFCIHSRMPCVDPIT
jgi:hypothetical protein